MSEEQKLLPGIVRELADTLEGLGAKATPGPWQVEYADGYITGHITSPQHSYAGNTASRTDSIFDENSLTADDAEFVIALRNALPSIVTALRAYAEREENGGEMKLTREKIAGAVARGWCWPRNEQKEMDSDLASAITDEICMILPPTPQEPKAEAAGETPRVDECERASAAYFFRINEAAKSPGGVIITSPDPNAPQHISTLARQLERELTASNLRCAEALGHRDRAQTVALEEHDRAEAAERRIAELEKDAGRLVMSAEKLSLALHEMEARHYKITVKVDEAWQELTAALAESQKGST